MESAAQQVQVENDNTAESFAKEPAVEIVTMDTEEEILPEETVFEEEYIEEEYVEEIYEEDIPEEAEEYYEIDDDYDPEEEERQRREEREQRRAKREKHAKKNKTWNNVNTKLNEFAVWCKKNKRTVSAFVAFVATVIVVVIVLAVVNRNGKPSVSENGISASMNMSVSADGTLNVPDTPLALNAYPEVNNLVNTYITARVNNDVQSILTVYPTICQLELTKIEESSNYIETIENIECYTKPGPYENSYIVFVKYDIKVYNWDILAPALVGLLVYTDDNGQLLIHDEELDENVANYIKAVQSQTDVCDLVSQVSAEYYEALDSNLEYSEYMTELNATIRNLVAEELAAEMVLNSASENQAESASDNDVDPLATFQVKATDTVNVRASDSENADQVGRVEAGTILECYEQLDNGWSRVDYNGEIAYISSQYLERLDAVDLADSSEAIGTVKIKETVNIRSGASTTSSVLGSGYMGETYQRLSDDEDGWIKIIYNNKVAYVKSEYVEIIE